METAVGKTLRIPDIPPAPTAGLEEDMTEHISKQFDSELDGIRSRVTQMGGLVESQILGAIEGFGSGDRELIDRVIADDHRVNAYEVAIDDDCAHILARRQPTAGDLRMVLAVSKTVTDLERIGDEASKIARAARDLYENNRLHAPRLGDVQRMGEMAAEMVHRVLDAFVRLDVAAATAVVRSDQEIDDRFRGLMRQLITYMMEDPRTISTALDIVFIAKSIERIGDHTKNIAENVIYIVKGKDVRHITLDQLEREALEDQPRNA